MGKENWWRWVDLNHRHRAYETPALPLSYTAQPSTITPVYGCVHRLPAVQEPKGYRHRRVGDILEAMKLEAPEEELVQCSLCGLRVPASELQTCFICKEQYCQYCGKLDFGRTFCSSRCRGFFFWGDGDQDEKDF